MLTLLYVVTEGTVVVPGRVLVVHESNIKNKYGVDLPNNIEDSPGDRVQVMQE